jgi:hypothetical protein
MAKKQDGEPEILHYMSEALREHDIDMTQPEYQFRKIGDVAFDLVLRVLPKTGRVTELDNEKTF